MTADALPRRTRRRARSPAEVYEEQFVPALFRPWGPLLCEAAQVGPGQRVLDVACGTGALTTAVAERVAPGGAAIGLDANPQMLAVARRKHAGIEWREGRAEALPFPDASFDAVVSQFGLMFFDDRTEGAARDAARAAAGRADGRRGVRCAREFARLRGARRPARSPVRHGGRRRVPRAVRARRRRPAAGALHTRRGCATRRSCGARAPCASIPSTRWYRPNAPASGRSAGCSTTRSSRACGPRRSQCSRRSSNPAARSPSRCRRC